MQTRIAKDNLSRTPGRGVFSEYRPDVFPESLKQNSRLILYSGSIILPTKYNHIITKQIESTLVVLPWDKPVRRAFS